MNILDLSTTFSADVSPFNNAMSTAAGQADAAFSLINSSAKAYLGSSGVCRYFVQATKAAADFGQILADMAAISEVSMKQIHDSLLRLPNYFGDVSQQAQSMYEIISSGFRDLDAAGLERFQKVISKSAKVIRADVYATGNAITTLANAYKLNIDQVEKLTDWFYLTVREGKAHGDDLARTMGLVTASASEGGVKLRELGAAIAILSRTQSASQSFIGLNQALNGIIKPTLKAQQAAKQWGIDISAARVQNEGLVPLLQELHDKVGGNVEALEAMFGNIRAGRAILTLTGKQFDDFIKVLGEFENMTGKGEEAFLKQIDTTKTAIQEMQTQFNKTSIIIGEDFGGVTRVVAGFAESIAKAFAGLDRFDKMIIYLSTIQYVLKSVGVLVNTIKASVRQLVSRNTVANFNGVSTAVENTNKGLTKSKKELDVVNKKGATRTSETKATAQAEDVVAKKVKATSYELEKGNILLRERRRLFDLGLRSQRGIREVMEGRITVKQALVREKYFHYQDGAAAIPEVPNGVPTSAFVRPAWVRDRRYTGSGALHIKESPYAGVKTDPRPRDVLVAKGIQRVNDSYDMLRYLKSSKAPWEEVEAAEKRFNRSLRSLHVIGGQQAIEQTAFAGMSKIVNQDAGKFQRFRETVQASNKSVSLLSATLSVMGKGLKNTVKAMRNLVFTGNTVSTHFRKWAKIARTEGSAFGTRYGVGTEREQAVLARYIRIHGHAPGVGGIKGLAGGFNNFMQSESMSTLINAMQFIGFTRMAWDFGTSIGRAIAEKFKTDENLGQQSMNKDIEQNTKEGLVLRRKALLKRVTSSKSLTEAMRRRFIFQLYNADTQEALDNVRGRLDPLLAGEEKQRDEFSVRTGRRENVAAELKEMQDRIDALKALPDRTFIRANDIPNFMSKLEAANMSFQPRRLGEGLIDSYQVFKDAFASYKNRRVVTRGIDDLTKMPQTKRNQVLFDEFVENMYSGDFSFGSAVYNEWLKKLADEQGVISAGRFIHEGKRPQSTAIPDSIMKLFSNEDTMQPFLSFLTVNSVRDFNELLKGNITLPEGDIKKAFEESGLDDEMIKSVLWRLRVIVNTVLQENQKGGSKLKSELIKQLEQERDLTKMSKDLMINWKDSSKTLSGETVYGKLATIQSNMETSFGGVPLQYYKQQQQELNQQLISLKADFAQNSKAVDDYVNVLKNMGKSDAEIGMAIEEMVAHLEQDAQRIEKLREKAQKIAAHIRKYGGVDPRDREVETNALRVRIARGGASDQAMLRLRRKQILEDMKVQDEALENSITAKDKRRAWSEVRKEEKGLRDQLETETNPTRVTELNKRLEETLQRRRQLEKEITEAEKVDEQSRKDRAAQRSQQEAELADIDKQMREYRSAFVQRTMEGVQSFSTERDVRGNMTNNALYHSVNLLSRIAPQFATAMSSSMNIGRTDISSYNTNRAVDAQRAVADALDTYIIDQRYANDNLGTNVAKILDTINTRQPVFLK